ncbi:response regulator transcription factor [Clostridium algidicarnis]|uniref:response regulator transcription factor n=1 Tax=Clostridium algidicarnis TaxID=37659 RepID=UPI001C0B49BE|nr:response regulator transcription factor [Clostridium algidicarnis]MBU3205052.1 response regulator transcription factor [Clostridium algidicarnis]MBU3213205.1 response regulator transcription factor [Clostridium algidicarnis]MBU3223260.1 response regulator transcription factor [Clostridium algidicarnis]
MDILIADDDSLIREGLKIILENEPGFQVVALAANGQEAFHLCKEKRPNIVMMDIRMPIMDGVISTRLIKQSFKDIKIVMLTTFKDEEYIKEAIKNGADGYILKSQSSEAIIETIKIINKGNAVFEKDIMKSLSEMISKDSNKSYIKQRNLKEAELTEREIDILRLIGEGMSNKEIAIKLYLGEGTVRNYVTKLLEKLDLRDRTQLAIYYLNT